MQTVQLSSSSCEHSRSCGRHIGIQRSGIGISGIVFYFYRIIQQKTFVVIISIKKNNTEVNMSLIFGVLLVQTFFFVGAENLKSDIQDGAGASLLLGNCRLQSTRRGTVRFLFAIVHSSK